MLTFDLALAEFPVVHIASQERNRSYIAFASLKQCL
jgi:hypothetical protein